MPRKRKTLSGEDAQNIKSVPGQRYGEGQDQQALQRAMPAPDMQQPVSAAPAAPPVFSAMPQAGPALAPDPMQVQQYLQTSKPNLLAGSRNPDQPVTAGLSSGPGPGPEVLARNTTPMRRYLERLSADTGNPKWKMLAQKAGL